MPEIEVINLVARADEGPVKLDIHRNKEIRVFRGEHGELAEGLAGVLASLQSWHTHPDNVEHLYAQWEEERGWKVCVVLDQWCLADQPEKESDE